VRIISWMIALGLLGSQGTAAALGEVQGDRVGLCREVITELLNAPDQGVPKALLKECDCIGIFPDVVKGAIGVGARFGRGIVTCRDSTGWSPPAFFTMGGGSFGFQIGGESSDLVLFFMTERSARSLLQSKFTLGGNATVAAGPMGRSAEASTDLKLDAEIYSYATSKGLFAGVSLEGARVGADERSNHDYYGAKVTPKQILFDHQTPKIPSEAKSLIGSLP